MLQAKRYENLLSHREPGLRGGVTLSPKPPDGEA